MPTVRIGPRSFDVQLVVFDKDGTLIDFHELWGRRVEASVEALVCALDGGEDLCGHLFRGLGYDRVKRLTLSSGPLATAPMAKIATVVAAVLYQHGLSWEHAETSVAGTFLPRFGAPLSAEAIRPRGDVAGLFNRLVQAQLRLAVATTDDRGPTAETLRLLAVHEHIEYLRCGDDLGMPAKPDPGVLHEIGQRLGVAPSRIMMVGDTPGDMMMARQAGCVAVGVTGGAGQRDDLAPHADVVIESLESLEAMA